MADIRIAEDKVGQPPHGDHPAVAGELAKERQPGLDLGPRRTAIRGLRAGMGGNDVPEEHLLFDPELGKRAMHDRRRGLGRPGTGQLTLGGEGDARDAGAAVAGGLADERREASLQDCKYASRRDRRVTAPGPSR